MNPKTRALIESLLSDPERLLQKKPFYRGVNDKTHYPFGRPQEVALTGTVRATIPGVRKIPVTQAQFKQELDPYSHAVLFDENVPAITVKDKKNNIIEIKQYRVALPFQRLILNKQVRHLTVNPMVQTLLNTEPTDKQNKDFIRLKQGWEEKNMEGAKTTFVANQKSFGDAAMLFYMTDEGTLGVRNYCYDDGYTIVSHKDDKGKHILECLYYMQDDTEVIDCYDDEYFTRLTSETSTDPTGKVKSSWRRYPSERHGFSENPLITHRGDVAWNEGQTLIESLEALYNTFIVIQKRHGWGIIYVKGQLMNKGEKLAGNVVLVDNSGNPESDAKILEAPSPSNMIETLKNMKEMIEIATGTTFILPENINISSDISGLAVELTQELDMATAQDGVKEWQNVGSKMMRLFKEGFARELVNTGENLTAATDFESLRVKNKFSVWKPKSEEGHNQMVVTALGGNTISQRTAVENCTLSAPDELLRIEKEKQQAVQDELDKTRKLNEINNANSATSEE